MDNLDSALAAVNIAKEQINESQFSGNYEELKKNITCNFCKRTGYIARYCFAIKRARNENTNSTNLL